MKNPLKQLGAAIIIVGLFTYWLHSAIDGRSLQVVTEPGHESWALVEGKE